MIYLIISAIVILICLFSADKSKNFYEMDWYKDAAKEFGHDYYYPPATHSTCMNSQGTYIRTSQHYKPIRHSTFDFINDKLTPWFVEIHACYNGGSKKLLDMYFGRVKTC